MQFPSQSATQVEPRAYAKRRGVTYVYSLANSNTYIVIKPSLSKVV